MKSNASVLTVAGAVALAAAAGITYAFIQPSPPEVAATPSVSPSPVTTVTQSPTVQASTDASTSVASKPPATESRPRSTSSQTSPDSEPATPVAKANESRTIESCVTSMAIVNDPNPPLNVRSAPVTNTDSNIVGKLKNGTLVTIASEQDGWFQILTPQKGWISKQNTESGCNQKVERVSFGSGSSTNIADRFIGTGSHKYLLRASQGQQMTINRNRGPFPIITAPDGTPLVGTNPGDENRSTWTGPLPQTGDYALVLDSNFKGYKYSFGVEIK